MEGGKDRGKALEERKADRVKCKHSLAVMKAKPGQRTQETRLE